MAPQKPGLRKSERPATSGWPKGRGLELDGRPPRRTPEEIAATKKKAAEERKLKEQAAKAKKKKAEHDIRNAARIEDTLAKAREEQENAYPRHITGMFN